MSNPIVITNANELYADGTDSIDWTAEPIFQFATEVDALVVLQNLGDDLRRAREEERHVLRYMEAAAKAARAGTTEDGPVKPQAIIGHSGVSRRTVYNWLGSDDATE
ncbi:hypothetical protein [Nocardia sp. N2S4-5]|uniref:hypothetical protein n=1 Tax=Nocardia sp. N2S4-5 TaxID=3351565 RepID=UPI0037D8FB1A